MAGLLTLATVKSVPSRVVKVDVLRMPPTWTERPSITLLPPATLVAPGVSATRSKKLRAFNGSS